MKECSNNPAPCEQALLPKGVRQMHSETDSCRESGGAIVAFSVVWVNHPGIQGVTACHVEPTGTLLTTFPT